MNVLFGIRTKQGQFANNLNQIVNFNSLRLHYLSDEDADTIGWTCSSIKCNPELDIVGAPDLVSLLGCPVYFVIDPNSVGMDSKGDQKAPVVSAIIKAGEPVMQVLGDSPSAPTEGHDKNTKKGEKT